MRSRVLLGIIAFIGLSIGCSKLVPQAPESNEVLAEPLADLTDFQLTKHLKGDVLFAKQYTSEEGLGPIFVQSACENCHAGDGKGSKFNTVVRFGYYNAASTWNEALHLGGPQLQPRAIANYTAESVPNNVMSANLLPMNVTGLGYFEAVEDQYLLDLVAEQAVDGKVSGRLNYLDPPSYFEPTEDRVPLNDQYIGRFGRKSSSVDLAHRVTVALVEDMGLTSDNDTQDPINFGLGENTSDGAPDPEISSGDFDALMFYMRTLEAPRRRDADNKDVVAGEQLFTAVGCANCHRAVMETGSSEFSALNRVEFYPYSDLLIHEMGPDLDDGYTEGNVATSEWRTPPLWGIGLQTESQGGELYLLHDGRATTYDEAIQYHGGEAEFAKDIYNFLDDDNKELIFTFLNSL
ncbi:MAG: thiol oxidoreductase [Flavobacteriales bacterium]|nr:thiol oxidoreductase [Flavobacteriales bacterium]